MLEAQVADRELASDGGEDRVALRGGTVVEVDHVGAVGAGRGADPGRADAGPHDDAIAFERRPDDLGVARVVRRRQPWSGLDDGRRHTEAAIHLGQLATGRTTAQDQQAPGQLAGQGRLLVGPDVDVLDAVDRRSLRHRADGDHHVGGRELVDDIVVVDGDAAAARDGALAAVDGCARRLQRADVPRVVGIGGIGRPVDHVVTPRRGSRPGVRPRVGVVLRGAVQERLRWHAADVRARAAEPAAIDDRDRGSTGSSLVRGGFAGGPGADDDDVEGGQRFAHPVSLPRARPGRAVVVPRRAAPRR